MDKDLANRLSELPQSLVKRLLKGSSNSHKIGFKPEMLDRADTNHLSETSHAELSEDEKTFIQCFAVLSIVAAVAQADGKIQQPELDIARGYFEGIFDSDEFEDVFNHAKEKP